MPGIKRIYFFRIFKYSTTRWYNSDHCPAVSKSNTKDCGMEYIIILWATLVALKYPFFTRQLKVKSLNRITMHSYPSKDVTLVSYRSFEQSVEYSILPWSNSLRGKTSRRPHQCPHIPGHLFYFIYRSKWAVTIYYFMEH